MKYTIKDESWKQFLTLHKRDESSPKPGPEDGKGAPNVTGKVLLPKPFLWWWNDEELEVIEE